MPDQLAEGSRLCSVRREGGNEMKHAADDCLHPDFEPVKDPERTRWSTK